MTDLHPILKELSERLPERFGWITNVDKPWITTVAGGRGNTDMHALAACLEECEARGWNILMYYDADHKQWDARIMDAIDEETGDFPELAYYDAELCALSIATSLRDALKAEKT